MPLKKRTKTTVATEKEVEGGDSDGVGAVKRSKRDRLRDFFRSKRRKGKVQEDDTNENGTISVPKERNEAQARARDSKIAESPKPVARSSSTVDVGKSATEKDKAQGTQLHDTRSQEKADHTIEQKEEEKTEPLTEEQLHTLFAGAPHFMVQKKDNRSIPTVSHPWDTELRIKDVSDSVQLAQPAFSAATLHKHLPMLQDASEQTKPYHGYDVGVVELPSMLSAQGTEPGSIGYVHFLELPISDNLLTDLQQSQSSNGFLEGVRNKEQMQSNPEKLGIRAVDMGMVYDRLMEFGDLIEAFQESPKRMTILNNQSSGDLYATLFGKFLLPPKYDDSAEDPTGLKVQIDTLLKILRLKGVWYDFSLVEWRIRLGQVLWSDPDSLAEHESHSTPLWSKRDILLLQMQLSCELLLRLDAVSSMDADDVIKNMHVTPENWKGFLNLKTKKIDWDLILARRFLDNILVVKESEQVTLQTPKGRGLLSMLSSSKEKPQSAPTSDIVLLPRHQARQLSGLLHFAETIQWPRLDLVLKDLAQKLGVADSTTEPEQQMHSYAKYLDPSTPSSISVYGTPLASPRSISGLDDSYFGNITKPNISRSNSKSLRISLSSALLAQAAAGATDTSNIGGWLSRSFLTGLVLPGEPISHFLISTLLENDKLAIAALGDAANLYGGFIYSERSWWSKTSIVARTLAGMEGSAECMGWISLSKLPEGLSDGWYAISSKQIPVEQPPRITAEEGVLARDSAVIPGDESNVKPEDLVLPMDPTTPPVPSVEFSGWRLAAVTSDLSDNDESPGALEIETHAASLTFASVSRDVSHTIALTYDVQFVTSMPCSPPATSSTPNAPVMRKQSPSRSSSTRSGSIRPSLRASRRNSHGFEPLLSHPPDSPALGPTRTHSPVPDEEAELKDAATVSTTTPLMAHPLHASYKYTIVTVTDVLDKNFAPTLKMAATVSSIHSPPNSPLEEGEGPKLEETKTILILDARASKELELLARAWCAQKGLHALIGRVGRTCLACCVREARGLGIQVIVRV